MSELTDPEHRCERERGKRIAEHVRAMGGCAACLNRAVSWGVVHCGLQTPRQFPDCADNDFRLDVETIKRVA